MTRRRLIALVTFLAGLYYFLEFVVPPTVPWRTVQGEVVAVTTETLLLRVDGEERQIPLQPTLKVYRERPTGAPEQVELTQLRPGDRVRAGPTTYLSDWLTSVNNFFIVLGAMAWGMGLISLVLVHSGNIRRRRPEWYGSVLFFLAVGGGMLAGLGYGAERGWLREVNDVVFNYLLRPMSSTVFSLLAFHMATAAYRAFRIRSGEAALMMASAFIVMLGQIPIGLWLTHGLPPYLQLPVMAQWILYIANSAAVRGMWFGMMVGAIAVGLRFWLSLERGAFFEREV
ncbi:MAG: hypothetical protein RMM06_11460 [Armatimonadota bacterium]|nr:hypothetical protein [Armatimonadota bacterium]MDW8291330.1 hypothetical protein [Armatimonadota bacterium]